MIDQKPIRWYVGKARRTYPDGTRQRRLLVVLADRIWSIPLGQRA